MKGLKKQFKNITIDTPNMSQTVKAYAIERSRELSQKNSKRRAIVPTIRLMIPSLMVLLVLVLIVVNLNQGYQHDTNAYTVQSERDLRKVLMRNSNQENTGVVVNSVIGCSNRGKIGSNQQQEAKSNCAMQSSTHSDIVSKEDNTLYNLTNQKLEIYDISSKLATVKKVIDLPVNSKQNAMYITDKYIIIISNASESSLLVYQKTNYDLVKTLNIKGKFIDTRLENDHIYFVANSPISEQAEPTINEGTGWTEIPFYKVRYLYFAKNECYTIIGTLSLVDFTFSYEVQLGSNTYSAVYMSSERLYLASTKYNEKAKKTHTTIYVYTLKQYILKYSHAITFEGIIKNQTCISEYAGNLRLAVINSNDKTVNQILVYDKNGKLAGKLENIGSTGEIFDTVHFDENVVSVTTDSPSSLLYRIVFVKNVTPQIIGVYDNNARKTYLNRIYINDDSYLLGFGRDAARNYNISLYSDTDKMTQIGSTYTIDSQGDDFYIIDIEAFRNFQLVFVDYVDEAMLLGFPIKRFSGSDSEPEYTMLSINPNDKDPISLLAHFNDEDKNSSVKRIVKGNDCYYVVTSNAVNTYSYIDGQFIKN